MYTRKLRDSSATTPQMTMSAERSTITAVRASLHELDHGEATVLTLLEAEVMHGLGFPVHMLHVAALGADRTVALSAVAEAWLALGATMSTKSTERHIHRLHHLSVRYTAVM
ncbi:MAG: hypothetical protein JXE06_09190 [Coriobacteriia bacterium]|nr:hypothetical protein [Coriobacteriia bacterium]MBN2823244.1 hypothetical protein [Coriobacteriia bacterium]